MHLRNYFSICLMSVVQTLGVEAKLPNFDQFSQILCPTPLIVTFRYILITFQIPFHKSYLDGNNEMHWLKCHTCISTMWVIFIHLLFGTLCIHECTDFICFIFITMLFPLRWLLRAMGLSITFSLISIKMRKKIILFLYW